MLNSCRSMLCCVLIAILVAACGGGGGGAESPSGGTADPGAGVTPPAPTPTPAPSQVIAGKLTVVSTSGRMIDAGAGLNVSLQLLDSAGTPGASIAVTQTGADGSYSITLPANQAFGVGLVLSGSDGKGASYRALALQNTLHLGPASEAFFLTFIAAQTKFKSTLNDSVERLARLQHNATLALSLLELQSGGTADAVAQLRDWLASDPASVAALDAVATKGKLPATLGDIGGLFGAVRGARELSDSLDGLHTVTVLPIYGNPDQLEVTDKTALGGAAPEVTRIHIEADGLILVSESTLDQTLQVLQGLIGPYKTASFDLTLGKTLLLTNVQRATTGYDFDGDNKEDQLSFQVEQTNRGIETLAAFGKELRALHIHTSTAMKLSLSGGGSISVAESKSQWSVPFAGPVRVDSSSAGIDAKGQASRQSSQQWTQRAVQNDVSWPGRVRLIASDLKRPQGYDFSRPLTVTNGLQVTYSGLLAAPCCIPDTGIALRDVSGGLPGKELTIERTSAGARLFVSPDGTKIYAALSVFLDDQIAMAPDEAARQSAVIVRYDAKTLAEEARFTLPPRPSVLAPGLAFPRNLVFQVVASPLDATQIVVQTYDLLLVRGSTVAPQALGGLDVERSYGSSGKVGILDGQAGVLAWDETRNELWIEFSGGGPLGRIVPVADSGLNYESMRAGLPYFGFASPLSTNRPVYERVLQDRGFADGFRTVVDTKAAAVLRRLADSKDAEQSAGVCAARGEGVICSSGNSVLQFDRNLQEVSRLSLQNDLRSLARGLAAPKPGEKLFSLENGDLVFLATIRNLQDQDTLTAVRLRF